MLPGVDLNGHLPPDNPQLNLGCSLSGPRLASYLSECAKLNIGLHFFLTTVSPERVLEKHLLGQERRKPESLASRNSGIQQVPLWPPGIICEDSVALKCHRERQRGVWPVLSHYWVRPPHGVAVEH